MDLGPVWATSGSLTDTSSDDCTGGVGSLDMTIASEAGFARGGRGDDRLVSTALRVCFRSRVSLSGEAANEDDLTKTRLSSRSV